MGKVSLKGLIILTNNIFKFNNYEQGTNGSDGYVKCGTLGADNKFTCEYATTDDNGNIVNKTTTCQSK